MINMVWGTTSTAGRKPVATMPSLDPGQQQMASLLQKLLSGAVSPEDYLSGLTGFLGKAGVGPTGAMPTTPTFDIPAMPRTPAITARTAGASLLDEGGVGGALSPEVLKAFRDALSGRVSEEYFQKTVAGPATRTFREEIAPTIGEGFVGPGTFWGGAKGEAVEREGMRLAEGIAAARGQMSKEALDRQLQAALGYGEFAERAETRRGEFMAQNYRTWMSARSQDYATWSQATGKSHSDWLAARSQDYATWQRAKTEDIATYMQSYAQSHAAQADTINAILTYLQTPTMLAYQDPEYIPGAIKKAMEPKKPVTPYTGNIPGKVWLESAGGYV